MKRVAAAIVLAIVASAAIAAQEAGIEDEVRTIASLRRGEYAVIRAEIYRFRDEDEILVRDETGRIEVYLGAVRRARRLLDEGETVTIAGWVGDDRFVIRRELYASTIILEDGTVIESERPSAPYS